MKKISVSIFAILILCVVAVSGCTKADIATLTDCYNLYQQTTEKYDGGSNYIFDENGYIDLHSEKAYNQYAYQEINKNSENFKLLKYGNQFQVLADCSISFYKRYSSFLKQEYISYEKDVKQDKKTVLYNCTSALKNNCQDILDSKSSLLELCVEDFSVDNKNVNNNLKRYIESYKNLLGTLFDIGIAYDDIYSTYMVRYDNTNIDLGEGQRLLESAKLYVAKYVYLTYILNQDAFYDCTQQDVYNKLLKINTITAINFSTEPTQDEMYIYNYMTDKINNFKTELKNYQIALQKQDDNDAYKEYVNSFESVVKNFVASIMKNLAQA